MNKKILIGNSIFVLTLLLLMPSVPAIHQKTIEDRTYIDLFDQLDFKDVREKNMDLIRHPLFYDHPLLYAIVIFLGGFRWLRCLILAEISFDIISWNPPEYEVYHPILFLRCIWLLNTFGIWCSFWDYISQILGWNWDNIASIIID